MTASSVPERLSSGGKINEDEAAGESSRQRRGLPAYVVKGFLCDMTVEKYTPPLFLSLISLSPILTDFAQMRFWLVR
jgi:hypothetical protein